MNFDLEILRILILALIFGAVLLAAEALVSAFRSSRAGAAAVNERLRLIAKHQDREVVYTRLRRSAHQFESLPAFIAAPARRVANMATAAGLTTRPHVILLYIVITVIVVFLTGLLLASRISGLTPGRISILLAFALALGVGLPLMYLSRRAEKRRKRLIEQFPVALDIFIRGLKAGHPVFSAIKIITQEMSDPIGTEFGLVLDEVTYGADFRSALQSMADRCDVEDVQLFVICLSVQGETGGNLTEILSNLAVVIRDRASMLMKVRALSSEGRMTGVILTVLPLLTFTGMFLMNPRFYLEVSDDPAFLPGFAALIAMFIAGVMWIRKLVDLKV
jgi:tight adherence protein B